MSENKIHIEQGTVQETLVIPLYSRKVCNTVFPDFFRDDKAEELVDRLDYDFGGAEKQLKSAAVRFGSLEVAVRQKALMQEVREYLQQHPKASVVNLGCGLDQSAENCDNGSCRIYNVDLPDVIAIREQLIPPADRVTSVAADLNDPAWFDRIPREDGAVFFASGVFYYFTPEQIRKLFCGMAEHFPGGKLVFDIAGKKAVRMMVKGWVRQAGISGVHTSFYVNSIDAQLRPWLKNAKVSSRGYLTGYFDLREKSIPGYYHLLCKVGDRCMKMQIIRLDFEGVPQNEQ